MNLVDQIFEQAKAGSANGASMIAPFEAGVQAGQRQQQINLSARQLAMEAAQQPLKMEQMGLQNQLNAAKLQDDLLQHSMRVQGLDALNQFQQDIHGDLTNGDLDTTLKKAISFADQHPVLWGTPEFTQRTQVLFKMKQEADMAKSRLMASQARQMAAQAAQFRSLPESARLNSLAQEAEAAGDFETANQFYKQSVDAGKKYQIEQEKVEAERERIKANQARTEAINSKTEQLSRSLSKVDAQAMSNEMRLIQDLPNSKMDLTAKQAALDKIHEKYATRATQQNAPVGSNRAAATGRVRVKSPDGKVGSIPADQLDEALKGGYEQVK